MKPLRIFLSFLQSQRDHPLPAYKFWRRYLVKGCEEAGINYVEAPNVDWAEGLLPLSADDLKAWRGKTWEKTIEFIKTYTRKDCIDIFLSYLYPFQIEPAAITEIQRIGIPCVNFFCDNVREFRHIPKTYYCFDLHWVPEFEALAMYSRAQLPVCYRPMPVWVPNNVRNSDQLETEPVTFLGSADILRKELLATALHSGADFIIRGNGWNDTRSEIHINKSGGSLLVNQVEFIKSKGINAWIRKIAQMATPSRTIAIAPQRLFSAAPNWNSTPSADDSFQNEYIRITREAMVTLGVNRVPTFWRSLVNPLTYSRLRDIEAPMVGACYLTECASGLDDLYHLGTDIEVYRTPHELATKLTELRKNPGRRRQMRRSAQKRALSEHSIPITLNTLAKRLGLSHTG